jgi:hypothetical protein
LFPFRSDDYVVVAGTAAPQISGFSRNPITPTGAQDVSVFATITDVDGTVTSANLFYAVGVSNATYLSVPMTASGSTYAGTIPNTAFSDGDIVKYYVGATDNDNLTAYSPNIPGGTANPLFFAVRDNGTTIYDVQFTPFNNGNSAYSSLDVTVEGIVTASAQSGDLGYVYIQQPGQTQWAGLSLVQNSGLANLKRGDEVRVTGKIEENFGFTRMAVSNLSVLGENRPLPAPVVLDPALFSTYDFAVNEAYESMVVKLKNPAANKGIVVVDENADASQFGEYRVGSSILDPLSGCRVLAGRVTNTAFSSLNFSYVNDAQWATTDGIMNVTSCVVVPGDTMASLTGIMHYSFNNMKLFPRNNADAELFNGTNCPGGVSGIDLLPGTELTLYPNPASSQVTLDFTFPRIVRGTVTLSDLTGRQVLRQPILGEAGRVEMSTAHLAAGAYLMTVAEQGVIIAREKLIIVQ